LRTGKPLLANQKVYESLVESGEVEVFGAPTNDWLGVPLIIEDKTIGVLAIQLYDMNLNYREDDRQLMTFVSSVVASAIERKQVQQEIKYSYELQDVLNSLLTISLENIPLTDILTRALDIIISVPYMTTMQKGGIFLVENDADKLVLKS